MDFTRKSCPVCSKRFAEDDDIVVCPKCGAPYHRECYQLKGACIFPDLHKSGQTWHDENDASEDDDSENINGDFIVCGNCGHKNSKDSIVCEKCGDFLTGSENAVKDGDEIDEEDDGDPFRMTPPVFRTKKLHLEDIRDFAIGVKKDDDFDGVTGEELMTYVGSNELYYGPIFSAIKNRNQSRFNFSTLIFQGIWYFHRKQYLMGIIIGLLTVIPSAVQYFAFTYFKTNDLWAQAQEEVVSSGYASYREYLGWVFGNCDFIHGLMMLLPFALTLIGTVVTVILAFRANRSYYKRAIKKIKNIKKKNNDKSESEILEIIKSKGGVNQGLSLMMLACELIFTIAFIV